MQGQAVGLTASPRGNGCGLAVVALPREGQRPLVVRLSVLPRMWPHHGPSVLDLDAAPEQGGSMLGEVFEMQPLLILGGPSGLARQLADALLDIRFDEPSTAEDVIEGLTAHEEPMAVAEPIGQYEAAGRQVDLFAELGHTAVRDLERRYPEPHGLAPGMSNRFWELIESVGAHDLVGIPRRYADRMDADTYLASTLLAHAPELRPLMRRQFVREAEDFLRRRRVHFRAESEELMAIRGRIDLRGIARRAAAGALPIACQFDELDHNSRWQQLLRSAARLVAREESDHAQTAGQWDFAARAAQVERRLGDVDLVAPRTAYERCRTARVPRSLRPARGAIALAEGLIVGRYPLGLEDDANTTRPGIAAAVRVPTARLFERLLATLELGEGTLLRPSTTPVQIRLLGPGKAPDLHLTTRAGRTSALVDAKYKPQSPPMRLSAMPMGDQYQQYGYAAATGLPTLFVYVLVDPQVTGLSTHDHDTLVINHRPGPRIAAIAIPFPTPDQASDLRTWQQQAGKSLRPCLAKLLSSEVEMSAPYEADARLAMSSPGTDVGGGRQPL